MALRMITRILLLALLPLAAFAGLGERGNTALGSGTTSFLPVHEAYQASARIDGQQLHVDWRIADHYYLYRHAFKGDTPVNTPAGISRHDEFFGDTEVYYDHVSVSITLPDDATQASLSFQGCADAGLCYPPETLYWAVDMEQGMVQPVNALPATPASHQLASSSTPSLLWVALAAFIGGLILNLMPCVFPVLSLKVIAITTHAHRGSTLLHSLCYAGGVIGSFLLVGGLLLAIRAGGSTAGWGFQLQSPQVITALAWLFTGITITLAGGFTPGLRWLGVGQQLTEGNTPLASFFTGALAVVVASPCTAPFMATALGYAITQPAAITLTVFACLGAGMAAPFVILGLLPPLVRCLPRPGPWMEHFKHVLTIPMAATIIWLLWVLSHQASHQAVILAITGCLLLIPACWLLDHHSTSFRRNIARGLLALSLLPLLIIQPDETRSTADASSWSTDKVAQLRAQGQPVFLNVTADWCITCLANEKLVLDTDATRELFERHNIAYLKADWTRPDPAIEALLESFGRSGVPLYVLYPANLQQPPVVLSQILRPSSFKELVDSTLEAR